MEMMNDENDFAKSTGYRCAICCARPGEAHAADCAEANIARAAIIVADMLAELDPTKVPLAVSAAIGVLRTAINAGPAASRQAAAGDMADVHGSANAVKAVYWFSTLEKCHRLLGLPDDEPIPSGVLRAVVEIAKERQSIIASRRAASVLTDEKAAEILVQMREHMLAWGQSMDDAKPDGHARLDIEDDGEVGYPAFAGECLRFLAPLIAQVEQVAKATYGPVHVVGDLVRNLLTLDQAMPIHAAFHVDFDGKRRCRTRPVIVSRERVIDGKWVDNARNDVPYAAIVWAKPQADEAVAAPSERAAAPAPAAQLDPVEGDLLPPVGSKVLIHLARQDAWVEHTVSGYYVWGALSHQVREGEKNAHRVFVRVKDAKGYDNARLLSEVRAHHLPTERKGGEE